VRQTDEHGRLTFATGKSGLYALRARRIERQAGERDGKKYGSIRHYSTLALPVTISAGGTSSATYESQGKSAAVDTLPPLPDLRPSRRD